eukprot:gene14596-10436_t
MPSTSTASAVATAAPASTAQQLAVLSRTALPLVDQEYDIPEYKTYVDYLIQEEMKSYQPPAAAAASSLADRFPSLWSDDEVDACLARIDQRKLLTEPKLDPHHHQPIAAPTGRQANDVSMWHQRLQHVKAQLLHQENELTGLDMLIDAYREDSPHVTTLQRQDTRYTAALTALEGFYTHADQATARSLMETQKSRQTIQTKAYPALYKYWQRKQTAYLSRGHVEAAYETLAEQLRARGFDFDVDQRQAAEEAERLQRLSYEGNNTVREYETVTVHTVDEEDDDNDNTLTGQKRSASTATDDEAAATAAETATATASASSASTTTTTASPAKRSRRQ